MIKKPILYGPDNRPLIDNQPLTMGVMGFVRDAAKRTGSMANWIPRRFFNHDQVAREREDIIARSINLVNDDPHAAGIIDALATTIIGAGLHPHPSPDPDALGISKDQAKKIRAEEKAIYKAWAPTADASGRMTDGEIQHLKCRCLFGFGESLEIIHMKFGGGRPYMLCSQVINPLRLKTPTDKRSDGNIRDGVEIGKYGEPIAYWIKKVDNSGRYLADSSKNFVRIPTKKGHRWLVLHDFVTKDPEQFRGYPLLSPAMRFFRDFADLMGAELMSNVITAAMSVFVEADNSGTIADAFTNTTNYPGEDRMQEISPGEIWYGATGEKPHLLSADRPGTTFEPFTKLLKKSIAMATGIPYPVLFKDIDGVSFAGFRSAMLEAWRVYDYHRKRIGQKDCQKKFNMLMEEAFLIGELSASAFYRDMHKLTACEWIGAPKGDIEPYKAIKSDVEKFKARVKPLERIIIEDGGAGLIEVANQIEDELVLLREKKLILTGAETSEGEQDGQ